MLTAASCDNELERVLLADADAWNGAVDLEQGFPGLPDGDRAEGTDGVSLVVDAALDGPQFRVVDHMELVANEHDQPDAYSIAWTARRPSAFNGGGTTLSIVDTAGNVAVRFVYDEFASGFTIEHASGESPEMNIDGHRIAMETTGASSTYSLSIQEVPCPATTVDACTWTIGGLQFIDAGFGAFDRVVIEGGDYFFDDFSVITTN